MTDGVVLVTGGAGFVGSHSIVELLNAGFNIVVVDNLVNAVKGCGDKPTSLQRIENITKKHIIFHEVSLLDKAALTAVFKKHRISSVIHFAALKAVGESWQMPLEYYKNNITGTCVLMEVMREQGVKRLVFSSSCTVYGNPKYVPVDENHPIGFDLASPYGKTKFFAEEVMRDVATTDKEWKVILLRYFNPVGAHESGEIGEDPRGIPNNLMPYIAQVAIGARPCLQVFGNDYNTHDGTGVRDYVHVMDIAAGHVAAVEKLDEPGFAGCHAYNLGTGQGYSVLDIVKAFEEASGRKVPYKVVERREGDIDKIYANGGKAEKELYWKATRTLQEMCKDAWRWQAANPKGFAD